MIIIYISLLIILIINPNISKSATISSIDIFINNLLPILLPSTIIIDLISNEKSLILFCYKTFPLVKKIIHINYPKSFYIILISFISGTPLSTKLIKTSLDNSDIDKIEANSLVYCFSYLSISYLIIIFNKFNIPLYYILLNILNSIIIFNIINKKRKIEFQKPLLKKRLECFFNSISNTSLILINILVVIILFNVFILLFNINPHIYPYFEPLGGQLRLIGEKEKSLIKTIVLSSSVFLGFSIHLQILNIYNNFSYIKFLSIRLLLSLLIFGFFFIHQ